MEGPEDFLGDRAFVGEAWWLVGRAELPSAPIGDFDLDVLVPGGEG